MDSELENLELSLVSVIKELGDLEKLLHLSGPVSSLIQPPRTRDAGQGWGTH